MSFELKFFVCRHVSIWGFRNLVCPYPECPYPENWKSPWLRQYQSYISNWYINGKVFTAWKPRKFIYFSKKFEIELFLYTEGPYPKKRNHPSFVDISPTLVIDASMERSSRVLQHVNRKIWIIFQKSSKLNFDLWRRVEITLASSISVLH